MKINQHPAVMFEILAKDEAALSEFYAFVFGWSYQTGSAGFNYVKFPVQDTRLLGGIGQAADAPGQRPGASFYLQVPDLIRPSSGLSQVAADPLLDPTRVDGYRFAMFTDPEGNAIGLIERATDSEGKMTGISRRKFLAHR